MEGLQEFLTLEGGGEGWAGGVGFQDQAGVRVEGHDSEGDVQLRGEGAADLEHGGVAEVDAIEVADAEDAAAGVGGE